MQTTSSTYLRGHTHVRPSTCASLGLWWGLMSSIHHFFEGFRRSTQLELGDAGLIVYVDCQTNILHQHAGRYGYLKNPQEINTARSRLQRTSSVKRCKDLWVASSPCPLNTRYTIECTLLHGCEFSPTNQNVAIWLTRHTVHPCRIRSRISSRQSVYAFSTRRPSAWVLSVDYV